MTGIAERKKQQNNKEGKEEITKEIMQDNFLGMKLLSWKCSLNSTVKYGQKEAYTKTYRQELKSTKKNQDGPQKLPKGKWAADSG